MTDTDSNKLMIALVLIVVVMSVVFTWRALALKADYSSGSSEDDGEMVYPTPSAPPTTTGRVAIDIQPSTNGGGA